MSDPKDGEGRADDEATSGLEKDEDGPRTSRVRVGGMDIVVLSVPLPELQYPEGTSAAEQQIIDLVLQGLTVKEIAEQRGVSLRTVTTQLGAIFRKAGVNSQAELISMMTDGAPSRR